MKDMETRMDEDGDERKPREKGHDDKERDGMQNQVNVDPEPHYIIRSGGMVNLSEFVSKTSAGKSEDVMAAESVETLQHVVGDGSQRSSP
ncbi:hypothetical protein F7725_017919 [Dissostichus mawsoni]|uniref:Uncharacterized protein n=1 Tax=Dissostichus mawsoni TaxID=36200 RepID=A0A7J5XQ54_DISMA|nr:hypothetical protein F7725_017919 [Dissostichus mawsoni]